MIQINDTIKKAGKLYEDKEYIAAQEILNEYILLNKDPEAYNLSAMISFALNNVQKAIDYLNKAIELEPKNTTFLNNLAIAYLNTDIQQAQKYFEDSLKIDPDSLETNKKLANVYISQRKTKEAIYHYEKIVKSEKVDFEVALNYAKLLNDIGEQGYAIQFINQALAKNPKSSNAHFIAAELFYNMDMPNEATKHYKEYLHINNQQMDSFIFSKIRKIWSDYSKRFYPHEKIKEQSYIDAYKKAIDENVKDKIVFEYGTNGGLFAMMAVKVGAKKVYICEKDEYVSAQIQEVIRSNAYEDKIEVINKKLLQIDDIKADIAIIDRFGSYIVDQNILNDIQYINNTILKEDSKLIPQNCSLYGMCIKNQKFEKTICGFDMRGFSIYDESFNIENINNISFEQTSKLFKIFDIDLKESKNFGQTAIEIEYLKDNSNGVALWYELIFSDDNKVSTYTKDSNYFKQIIWNIDIRGEHSLEVIYQNKDIFVDIINIEKKS